MSRIDKDKTCEITRWLTTRTRRLTRRTRIVARLGPATDPPGVMEELVEAGLDVARINYSHGSAAENAERVLRCRQIARDTSHPLAVLADLPGPLNEARG